MLNHSHLANELTLCNIMEMSAFNVKTSAFITHQEMVLRSTLKLRCIHSHINTTKFDVCCSRRHPLSRTVFTVNHTEEGKSQVTRLLDKFQTLCWLDCITINLIVIIKITLNNFSSQQSLMRMSFGKVQLDCQEISIQFQLLKN